MSSYSRKILEDWIGKIEVTGRVIDIGGSQKEILGRTKTWDVDDYKVLDLPEPHELKRQPDIINDINYKTLYSENMRSYFDVAFCLEVAEYFFNPLQALENINSLLKTGGILYLSTHFIYEIHPPTHYDYLRYTPRGISRLLSEAGFEIIEMINRDFAFPENAKKLYDGEGMRGDKHLYNIQGCLIKCKKI